MERQQDSSLGSERRLEKTLAGAVGIGLLLAGCGHKNDAPAEAGAVYPAVVVEPMPLAVATVVPETIPQPAHPLEMPLVAPTVETSRSPTGKLETFVDTYYSLAVRVEHAYGVPRDLTLAQAMHESAFGQSELTKKAYNFFGIKAHHVGYASWQGPVFGIPTNEVVTEADLPKYRILKQSLRPDGKYDILIPDGFRQYSSAEESFLDYGNYLRNRGINTPGEYYADAHGLTDPIAYLREILDDDDGPDGPQKSYATDPQYINKVIPYIQKVQAARLALGKV